jgi:uncharacterized protein (TIGR00369 family)
MARSELPASPEMMVELLRRRSLRASPFASWLDIDLIRAWDGTAELRFRPRAETQQHRGTIHGGVLMSLIDNIAGWAATTLLGPLVTTSITVHFHRPVAREVAALAVVQHRTRRTAVVTAAIRDASGELIATGLASFVAIDEPVEESPSESTDDARSPLGER